MPLQEYQDIVGKAAGFVTIAQFLSPIFICKKIISQGNTDKVDSTPFIGGIALGLLFLRNGYMLNDPTMTVVNVCAISLNIIYLLVFLFYTDTKGSVIQGLQKNLLGASVLIGYTFLDSNFDRALYYFSLIVTLLMFALIAAPLKDLGTIIKTKDTGSLPFPMIASGTLTTSLWLLYGFIIENEFVIVQNLVGLLLSVVQLSLFVIYPSKAKVKKED